MHRHLSRLRVCTAAVLLSGCASLAPPHERPPVPLPAAYPHGGRPGEAGSSLAAELDWRGYFTDPALQRLIERALAHNRDLRTAVLRVQGIDILVVSLPGQMLDLQQVRAFGIEPADQRFLVVKSMQHFRAAFQPIAGRVIVCDSGALATPQAHLRPYIRVRRPVWPLDRAEFAAPE